MILKFVKEHVHTPYAYATKNVETANFAFEYLQFIGEKLDYRFIYTEEHIKLLQESFTVQINGVCSSVG